MKVTDFEIMNNWKEYDAMNSKINCKSKWSVGDYVKHGDELWVIEEYFGKNLFGEEEYCAHKPGNPGLKSYFIGSHLESVDIKDKLPDLPTSSKCLHKNAYKNVISASLQFWVCPDCKEEVKEPSKSKNLNQTEVDALLEQFESMYTK